MTGLLHEGVSERSKKSKGKLLIRMLDSLVCSICHDYMFVPMMAQCGHNFCYSCITNWFDSSTNAELTCPQCRCSIGEEPHQNNTLQQFLVSVVESLADKIKDHKAFQSLLEEQKEAKASYELDMKSNHAFNGIFNSSAVGVVDEDDDGILRCSNCHWELEDDDEGICPHCNSRIRSRARSGNGSHGLEGEEEDEDEEEGEEEDNDESYEVLQELFESILRYKEEARFAIQGYQDGNNISSVQFDRDFPHLLNVGSPSESKVYLSSYSMYCNNDLTLDESERERRTELIKEIESIIKRGGNINQLRRQNIGERLYPPSGGYPDEDELDFPESDGSDNNELRGEPALIDLEADDSSDEEGPDSDFYENNEEDDGFVTGDSLDDAREEEEYLGDDDDNTYGYSDAQSDSGHSSNRDREQDDSDDHDHDIYDINRVGNSSKKRKVTTTVKGGENEEGDIEDVEDDEGDSTLRIPRRRFKVVAEGSDDE